MSNTVKCKLQYFKNTGKWYADGQCKVQAEHMFQVREEIEKMLAVGKRPGLSDGYEFIVYVTTDHPIDVPFLVMPRR
jgi:hypothetical protein